MGKAGKGARQSIVRGSCSRWRSPPAPVAPLPPTALLLQRSSEEAADDARDRLGSAKGAANRKVGPAAACGLPCPARLSLCSPSLQAALSKVLQHWGTPTQLRMGQTKTAAPIGRPAVRALQAQDAKAAAKGGLSRAEDYVADKAHVSGWGWGVGGLVAWC